MGSSQISLKLRMSRSSAVLSLLFRKCRSTSLDSVSLADQDPKMKTVTGEGHIVVPQLSQVQRVTSRENAGSVHSHFILGAAW